jgi:predicted unusual protein kinase regulating ubiquinone biosynthesis (AarF/ABC1/UbiB family)
VFRGHDGKPGGINLLDYGCIRIFPPKFVKGVIDLYRGLRDGDDDLVAKAYEIWGFRNLKPELVETLNIWARFIYGPLLDDRERAIAEGVSPGQYGREQAFKVHKGLKEKGPVTIPREFVFMDRAAIGLGGAFLHLDARLNFCQLFNEALGDFDVDAMAAGQRAALERAGLAGVI